MRVSRRSDIASAPRRAKTTPKPRPKPRSSRKPTRVSGDRFSAAAPRAFDLTAVLSAAGHVRRGPGPEGKEPLLGPAEQGRVAALFARLPAAKAAALQKLLGSVPEGAAQAVLLKAIAARANRLAGDERHLDVLTRFARLVRTVPEAELLERATVLDLDSRLSTSDTDLFPLWERRGTIRGRPGDGAATDNDSLLQRFTAACGPTVIQMMRAQADPVLAFAMNSEGRSTDSVHGETALFQRA